MSTRAETRGRSMLRRRAKRGAHARRRLLALVAIAGLTGLAAAVLIPQLHRAVREVTLPLRHEDIIRQQASEKRLDPALIAAVIFAESKFRDQTSPTGAKGLMQIQPATARFIARRSGGTASYGSGAGGRARPAARRPARPRRRAGSRCARAAPGPRRRVSPGTGCR